MGLITRIKGLFSRNPIKNRLDSEGLLQEILRGRESKTGIPVNWRTAQEAVTFMAGARVIAEGLAQVPCKIFMKQENKRVPATDKRLYKILHGSPNEWMTSYELFEQIGIHLVFCGNYFAFINRVGGEIYEILPFEPSQIAVRRDNFKLFYEVTTDNGEKKPFPAANMWHIRGPSWNGWVGLEGVKLAREAIGLSLATEEHGARLFRNGSQMSGILSSEQIPTKEKALLAREAWEAANPAGLAGTGKVGIVWGGLKFQSTAMLNDSAQFTETRRLQIEEICRALRIMPIMVGHTSDKASTYASAEQMFLAHMVHSMGPWYRRIETSIDKFLLTEADRTQGYYCKFITNALMRSAAKDRAEYFAKALGSGGSPAWMVQDEVRELEELDPMGGTAAALPIATNIAPAQGGNPNEGAT